MCRSSFRSLGASVPNVYISEDVLRRVSECLNARISEGVFVRQAFANWAATGVEAL